MADTGWFHDGWYDDPPPTAAHQVPRSSRRHEPPTGSWQEPSGSASPPGGWQRSTYGGGSPAGPAGWQDGPSGGAWERPLGQPRTYGVPPRAAQQLPVVGPTAALRGRAGGPGFIVPPGAVTGLYDPAQRSGWQLAHGVWEESGIGWEPPPEPDWSGAASGPAAPVAPPAPAGPAGFWPGDEYGQEALPSQPWAAAPHGAWRDGGSPPGDPGFAGAPAFSAAPAFSGAATFAGAPTFADTPAAGRLGAPPRPARRQDEQDEQAPGEEPPGEEPPGGQPPRPGPPRAEPPREPGEPDELYQAWQGSVRKAAAPPRMTAARRRRAWHVVRVGVPAAVVVTVGAGAVMMLTGKTTEMLASRGNQGSAAPGAAGSAVAFTGYPGQHGTVTVSSIAAAGATRLAVGGADGHPAIWRRAADGIWTLLSASSPARYQRLGMASLSGVADGPAGWIAVGSAGSGPAQHPVVLTSADGIAWQAVDSTAFATPGTTVMGVTAGRGGYVVVGKQVSNGRTFAALWWSGDLRNWVTGSNGGLDGRLTSSGVYAVGATATGFVAAGTHGGCHTIWTSADGRNWSTYDVPKPPGATDALLQQVAVNGTRVVTAGYVTMKAGNAPVVVVSTDGGRHWRQILLAAPAGLGEVTTLTAAGNGFIAAGPAGPVGAQHGVTWTSPDGLSWSAATPVSAGQITALAAMGSTVSGAAQRGAEPSVVTLTAP